MRVGCRLPTSQERSWPQTLPNVRGPETDGWLSVREAVTWPGRPQMMLDPAAGVRVMLAESELELPPSLSITRVSDLLTVGGHVTATRVRDRPEFR